MSVIDMETSYKTKGDKFMIKTIIKKLFKPKWIINSSGELGFRIAGINFYYYKWSTPIIGQSDDCKYWREIKKREFGEVIKTS